MKIPMLVALAAGLSQAQEFAITQVASGIAAPTDIQNAGDGSGRLFLAEQAGRIKILKNGSVLPGLFLNLSSLTRGAGERGLLGLAFPPGFAAKRRFYVHYTNLAGDTIIAMYRLSADPDTADPASETILLTIRQPFANHNGGQLAFGPDGYLYIGMGDGGSAGDPQGNGRRRDTLLGKMLRIDVESEPGRVLIPSGNPFAATAGTRPEIWALGLRNPWRFSFDRQTGDLWISDVGQNEWEEVNVQSASSRGGEDYGWNTMEASDCFSGSGCNRSGLVLPVAAYSHAEGCSITGGFVYRGRLSPSLRGWYLYADYCSGRLWGFSNGTVRVLRDLGFNVTTFGEDEQGELYLANAGNGTIHRIDGVRSPHVVSAASFAPGPLVPGSLATVFPSGVISTSGVTAASGIPLPLSLDGVSVTVNGIAAPLLAVANTDGLEQVNFQVPFGLTGTQAPVVVRRAETQSIVPTALAASQPGIFTANGRAIVVRPDYTLVTDARPLVVGDVVFLYASGLAAPVNAPLLGTAAPSSPLAVTSAEVLLAGIVCRVEFAGLAPGFVGLYQVNFRVPATAPSGIQDLRVRVGNIVSPAARVPVQ